MTVVAVEEASFLVPVKRIVGGIQIQDDLFRCLPMRGQEYLHEQPVHRCVVRCDFLVASLGIGRLRGQFQTVQRAFSRQYLFLGIRLLYQHRQQRVLPQLLVIIEIFVTEGQAIDRCATNSSTVCSIRSGSR